MYCLVLGDDGASNDGDICAVQNGGQWSDMWEQHLCPLPVELIMFDCTLAIRAGNRAIRAGDRAIRAGDTMGIHVRAGLELEGGFKKSKEGGPFLAVQEKGALIGEVTWICNVPVEAAGQSEPRSGSPERPRVMLWTPAAAADQLFVASQGDVLALLAFSAFALSASSAGVQMWTLDRPLPPQVVRSTAQGQ